MSEAIATATSTEMQNNFGRYLHIVMNGGEVIITRNGKEVGRIIPRKAVISYLTDSLTGILSESTDMDQVREERLKAKYESAD
ncbi:MAG: type II toxin-antitoxin system prevent-host-death family antitoxin [Clostridiales bacterium]|nr:type II toxin-antitoxin system prevent-host-death family antitoxin [Clostridiales bacterium]